MSVKPDFRQFFTCLKEKNIATTGDKMRALNESYFEMRNADGIINRNDDSNKTLHYD